MYTIAQLKEMDEMTLRQLNRDVVNVLRNKMADAQRRAANQFRLGEKAAFLDKHGRRVVMEITKFNDKTVGGVQLDAEGRRTLMKWRVAPSLLMRVESTTPTMAKPAIPTRPGTPTTPGAGAW